MRPLRSSSALCRSLRRLTSLTKSRSSCAFRRSTASARAMCSSRAWTRASAASSAAAARRSASAETFSACSQRRSALSTWRSLLFCSASRSRTAAAASPRNSFNKATCAAADASFLSIASTSCASACVRASTKCWRWLSKVAVSSSTALRAASFWDDASAACARAARAPAARSLPT